MVPPLYMDENACVTEGHGIPRLVCSKELLRNCFYSKPLSEVIHKAKNSRGYDPMFETP